MSYDFDRQAAYKNGKRINAALKHKVKLMLDFERKHRNGSIDMEEITAQIAKNGRLINEAVFSRRVNWAKGGEYAVEILLDCSGSMSEGIKMNKAKQALATLAHAFNGIPNIQYALTGFTDDTEIIIKDINQRKVSMKNIEMIIPRFGNCDGFNIRSSAKRLLRTGKAKKLLIVISDGQPAYSVNGESGTNDTKKAVHLAIKHGVDVIGIGIQGANTKDLTYIYPVKYMFNDTENLHKDLTNLILASLGQKDKMRLIKNKWEL